MVIAVKHTDKWSESSVYEALSSRRMIMGTSAENGWFHKAFKTEDYTPFSQLRKATGDKIVIYRSLESKTNF